MVLVWCFFAVALALVIHEGGHVLVARAARMRIEEVRLFFGRRLLRWRMGSTMVSVGWFPLGAYTLMPDAFAGRGLLARLAVTGAGPLASALATLLLVHFFPSGREVFPWYGILTCAHLGLALVSLSPVTGADSPAMIGMIADHWYLDTTGRIMLGCLWLVFPVALLYFSWPVIGILCGG